MNALPENEPAENLPMRALRPVPAENLIEGLLLPGPLRDRQGRILVPAGATLTAPVLRTLKRHAERGLFAADDWPEPAATTNEEPEAAPLWARPLAAPIDPAQLRKLSVDSLRVGMRLAEDIFDPTGALLLARGTRVTSRLLELLSQRSIRTVAVRAPVEAPRPAIVERSARANRAPTIVTARAVARAEQPWARCRLQLPDFWPAVERGSAQVVETAHVMEGCCADLLHGGTVPHDKLAGIVGSFADMLSLDSDLLPLIVALHSAPDEYLFEHCVKTALLSMALAAQLGLNREQVQVLGLGAILHDVGMLRVPAEIRLAPRPLTADEMATVRRHPVHALEILKQVSGLPREVGAIALQVHGPFNNLGYPRVPAGFRAHPHARIVAVADAFTAMTEARPYRPPLSPHLAVKELLNQGAEGRFESRVLRAFLDTVSAFPVGSLVELQNGFVGRVLRANPDHHTRPVIVVLDEAGQPTDWTVDLAHNDGLSIVSALPELSSAPTPEALALAV